MRLIDADRLKIFIKEHSYPVRYGTNSVEQGMTLTGISECIDEQPTAYDIDKVIDQLEIKILADALVGNRAAEDTIRECLNIVRGEQE